MIQRIQTIYLSGVMIACLMVFFMPLAKYISDTQGTYLFFITGVRYLVAPPLTLYFWQTFPLAALVALSLLLTIISIFLYKNRKTQVLLVNVTFLLHIVLILLIFLFYVSHFETLFKVQQPSYQFGIFLPVISLLLLVLASRAIRKDEALVKSADRLR
jgi:hypothetical protein